MCFNKQSSKVSLSPPPPQPSCGHRPPGPPGDRAWTSAGPCSGSAVEQGPHLPRQLFISSGLSSEGGSGEGQGGVTAVVSDKIQFVFGNTLFVPTFTETENS